MKTKQTPELKTSTGRPNTPATTPQQNGPKSSDKDGGVRVATAEFVAGAARTEQVPTTTHFEDAPEIAFAGRSNVGKSSLLNMILARRGLARTSNTPGCTRQINFFDIGLAKPKPNAAVVETSDAAPVDVAEAAADFAATRPSRIIFVDLPGYGYAKVSKREASAWKELLEGYLHQRPTLRAVCILVDVRRGLEQEEEDLLEFLAERPNIVVFIAATKMDKLSRSAQKPALAKLKAGSGAGLPIVATSAETGAGREAVWSRIFDACRVH